MSVIFGIAWHGTARHEQSGLFRPYFLVSLLWTGGGHAYIGLHMREALGYQ